MLTESQRMNREVWVEALRSGQYTQGSNGLAVDGKFCCLGVAADVLCGGVGEEVARLAGHHLDFLADDIAEDMLGLARADQDDLAGLNDTGVILRGDGGWATGYLPCDFLDIADTIELLTLADMEAP